MNTFTLCEADAAMCLWEALLSFNSAGEPWEAMLEEYGTATVRSHVLSLAKFCEADWNTLSDSERDEWGCFDWNYCPEWLFKNWERTA